MNKEPDGALYWMQKGRFTPGSPERLCSFRITLSGKKQEAG